ncbi:hypothetical protein [Gloeothece verrucosa]|uniref:Uncharacterized protein n=1 Tax=Gloeothece verrucosa (strain PCC 7822) TaxID=497965 RepID=E0U5I1_GLOV7|nr:hypothetical protein [Gloeothece verrucosa]ADN14694.1 conserved hypothetical protein [Gloeothece verrucosa PCC 7822]
MQFSPENFDKVVDYLENHEESLRIKKLVFCICKKYWENDPTILNGVSWEELIQEIVRLKPSNEQLTFSIYKLIKTLNRPKVYAPLGKTIVAQISRLYKAQVSQADESEQTAIIAVKKETSSPLQNSQLVIDQVVANLANHREESRIKKLIFAVSKKQWENDTNIIDAYGLKNLILELRQKYQNKINLREAFNKLVESLNKKTVYLAIATLILNQIEILYDTEVEYEEEKSSKIDTNIIETQIIHLDKTEIQSAHELTQISSINSPRDLYAEEVYPTVISAKNSPASHTLTQINLPEFQPVQETNKEYNLFEVRLEILQYTNPLRAKILLYSLLFQPWDQTGQDWSILKGYILEDFLQQLIESRKSVQEIETKLVNIARKQNDVDSNLQTVNVILQAVGHIL